MEYKGEAPIEPIRVAQPASAPAVAVHNPPPPKAPKPPTPDIKQLRADAAREAEFHSPAEATSGKDHWFFFSVPAKPVAGAPCVIYFNRQKSEALRHRPKIVLKSGFNGWEVEGPMSELAPAPNTMRDHQRDWWSVRVDVPEEAFDFNFVLHDTQSAWDNNYGKDFVFEVEGGPTKDEWIDILADRWVLPLHAALLLSLLLALNTAIRPLVSRTASQV